MSHSSWPWRASKAVATWLVALVILFEEWGWAPLARAMARLALWPPIAALERHVAALSPRQALMVFFLPALLLFPVKVGALWLLGQGRVLFGVSVLLLAKIASTGVVARIFVLTQPQLMRLAWFARAYGRWIGWKRRALARVRGSLAWRVARVVLRRFQRVVRPRR